MTVRLLGEGGMGLVIAAYDPKLDRKVALKLLHPAGDLGDASRGRLQQEARAMARIAHPNVVTVFEVGEVNGQAFIAMELIDGTTLRQWQKAAPRTTAELLAIYVGAGRGLAAAHAANLTHRDFKPENVLIGADGRPRVTDFGLVSVNAPIATTDDDTAATGSVTDEIAGTPRYMSPEQWRGGVVDAASDQFSFCVALWEAVYGEHPFTGDSTTALRLAVTTGSPRAIPRGRAPAWLGQALTRGLARAPDGRWPSMDALLTELTRRERARPRWLAVGGVLAIGAVAGTVLAFRGGAVDPCAHAADPMLATWNPTRANQLRTAIAAMPQSYAVATADRVLDTLNRYAGQWKTVAASACRATHVEHQQSTELLDRRMACLDDRRRELDALTTALADRLDVESLDAAPRAAAGLTALDGCSDRAGLMSRVPLPAPAQRPAIEALAQTLEAARTQLRLGHYDRAAAAIEPVIAEARRIGYPPVLASALRVAGMIRREQGTLQPATVAFEEAAVQAARAHADDEVAGILLELHYVVADREKNRERGDAMLPLVRMAVARAGDRAEQRAGLAVNEGSMADLHGDYAAALDRYTEAVTLYEQALGPSFQLATALVNQGNTFTEFHRFAEARAALERGAQIQRELLGAGHPRMGSVLNNLGWTAQEQGDLDAALDYHQQALVIKQAALGDHTSTATTLGNIGVVKVMQGHPEEGYDYLRRAAAMSKATAGDKHPNYARDLGNLAAALSDLGRFDEARVTLTEALEVKLAAYGEAHASTAYALENLAQLEQRVGRYDDALGFARRALAIRIKALGADHELTGVSHALVGSILASVRQCEPALASLTTGLAVIEKADDATSPDLMWPLADQTLCQAQLGRGAAAMTSAARLAELAKDERPMWKLVSRLATTRAQAVARQLAPAAAREQLTATAAALKALGPPATSWYAIAARLATAR